MSDVAMRGSNEAIRIDDLRHIENKLKKLFTRYSVASNCD